MSFAKQEAAVRARDLIKKLANQQVGQAVPGVKIGRVVSVDLQRLQAMVWFPGDEQPVPVSLFSGVIPGAWHSMFNIGDNSSVSGYGAQVVCEIFRGVQYITSVLTGGQFSQNHRVLNLTLISGDHGSPELPGDGYGHAAESFFNISVTQTDVPNDQAAVFGPFLLDQGLGFANNWAELGIANGRGSAKYSFTISTQEFKNTTALRELDRWFRIIPEKEIQSDSFGDFNEFHLDVCIRETTHGFNSTGGQATEVWFRLVNYSGNIDDIAVDVSLRTGLAHVAGAAISKRIISFVDSDPGLIKGYLGYHNSRYTAMQKDNDEQLFVDRFPAVRASTSGNWGKSTDTICSSDNTELTWTTSGGAGSNYPVSATLGGQIVCSAANTTYRSYVTNASRYDHDIYARFRGSAAISGSYVELTITMRQNTSATHYAAVVRINTTAQVDAFFRKSVASVVTAIGSTTASILTYAANTDYMVRAQLRGNQLRMKVWLASANEPDTWHVGPVTDTSIAVGAGFASGQFGFMGFRNTGNTNADYTFSVREVRNFTEAGNEVDPNDNRWSSGPFRSAGLRIADALQKTWIPDGTFTWDGSNITWTGKLWLSGIGRHDSILTDGIVGISAPHEASVLIPVMGKASGNTTVAASSAGVPLAAGQSLWCAIPPGVRELDLSRHLFIVDSGRDGMNHYIPEWAVFIAQRQPAIAAAGAIPIRLGNGTWLDKWHIVGSGGSEPGFATNWSQAVGVPVASLVGFKKITPEVVMMSGIAQCGTTVTAPSTVFTLPVGYRPLGNILVVRANAVGSGSLITNRGLQINTNGTVQCTNFPAATNPGAVDMCGFTFSLTAT